MGNFARDAVGIRAKTDLTVSGARLAADMLCSWRSSFALLQVAMPTVEVADDLLHVVSGAMHWFIVRTSARGAYIRTVRGLERQARAHGSRSTFRVDDMLWVDAVGQITRVINTFQLAGLKIA